MRPELTGSDAAEVSHESVGPPPRRARLTGRGVTSVSVTAAILIIAAIYSDSIAAEASKQLHIRTALRGGGNQALGQVHELRNPYHALKEYAEYTFVADGRTYTGEAIVPLELWHTIDSTGSLSILYLPENPIMNHPADWKWSPISEFDGYGVVILIAGLGCILFLLPQIQFERKLAVEGAATFGVVTKCSVRGKYGEFVTLMYEFQTEDGIAAHGRGTFGTPREIGTRILVLYLPQKTRRNAPYPLANWRVVKS